MLISCRVAFNNADLAFVCSSSARFGKLTGSVAFAGESFIYAAAAAYQYGYSVFPALAGIGGDSSFAGYGAGDAEFPSLTMEGTGGFFVPPQPVEGYAFFPALAGAAYNVAINIGHGSGTFPAVIGKGGDTNYGEGSASFAALQTYANQGEGRYQASIVSILRTFDAVDNFANMIVFVDETGAVTGTISGTRVAVEEFLGAASASGTFTIVGEFIAWIDEHGAVHGEIVNNARNASVWVVSVSDGATSQFDNYGFNSFFEHDGKYYGVADDGIYLLDGEDDDGVDISAFIETGKSHLGTPKKKSITNVYAGVSSTGKMLLTVEADGTAYTYEARSNSDDLKNHRFDVGRGLSGNYFKFILANQNGDDFDVELINADPVVLSRKI